MLTAVGPTLKGPAPCPPKMVLTESGCIAIAVNSNYGRGKDNCEHTFHAHLPHIHTMEENTFFVTLRTAYQVIKDDDSSEAMQHIWLDLKYKISEGKWQWQDDSTDVTWSNWEDGTEPKGREGFCAVIQKDGTWRDRRCERGPAMTICQVETYSLPPCPSSMAKTESGCIAIDVYDSGISTQNYAGGKYNCEKKFHAEAHFPHINNMEENNVFVTLRNDYQKSADVELSKTMEEIWLDLRYDSSEGKWQWQDDSTDVTWSNWKDASEPAGGHNVCAVIQMDGTWRSRKCTGESAMTICQLDTYEHHCPSGCNTGECRYSWSNTKFQCVCPPNFYGESCDQTCGGTVGLNGQESINGFSSTNYPSDATCTWVFQWQWRNGPNVDGFVPSVELTGNIEDTFGCDHDYVQLYEGAPHTNDQKHLSTLCGDVKNIYTGTPGKALTVVFKSNSDVEFPFNVVKFSIAHVPSTD